MRVATDLVGGTTKYVAKRTKLVAGRTKFVGGTTKHVAGRTKFVVGTTKHVAGRTKRVAARTKFVGATTKRVAARTKSSFETEQAGDEATDLEPRPQPEVQTQDVSRCSWEKVSELAAGAGAATGGVA